MAGINQDVIYGSNVDFTGTFPVSGQINLNGELLVGSTIAPFLNAYVPTGSNGLVVTTGPGTLDFNLSNIPNSALTNSTINVIAGTGLTGGGNVSLGGSVTLNASGGGTVTNVSGTANQVSVATGTTTPVISLVGPYTPATYTAHGVLVGEGTGSIVALAAGTAGQVLRSGGGSADPSYSTATFPSTAGTSGNVLTSDGTNWISSSPAVFTTTVTLTSAQIKTLHASPIQIIAAPGSGKGIGIIATAVKLNYGGTNVFVAGASQSIDLFYNNTTTPTTFGLIPNAMIVSSANKFCFVSTNLTDTNQAAGVLDNVNIAAYQSISATEISGNAAGNNTIDITVVYAIITY